MVLITGVPYKWILYKRTLLQCVPLKDKVEINTKGQKINCKMLVPHLL